EADVFRAIFAHLHVEPRCAAGAWLAHRGWATAMIDLSDGLATDLHHLCTESRVGAVVHTQRLPIDRAAQNLARDPLATALTGGEYYELPFTVPPRKAAALQKAYPRAFPPVTDVGEMTSGRRVRLLDAQRRSRPLPPMGYDHFRRRSRRNPGWLF